MGNSGVSVTLPDAVTKDIVRAQIQAAVAAALASNPEALVRAVVDAAMSEKRESYDRQTIWDKKVNEAIREAAQEALADWIKAHTPAIRRAITKRLDQEKKGIFDKVVDSIADAAKSTWVFRLGFKEIEDR